MGVGARIRQTRLAKMIPVSAIARLLECDIATINGIETETIPCPRDFYYRLSHELGVSVAFLEQDSPLVVVAEHSDSVDRDSGLNEAAIGPVAEEVSLPASRPAKEVDSSTPPPLRASDGVHDALTVIQNYATGSLSRFAAAVAANPLDLQCRGDMERALTAIATFDEMQRQVAQLDVANRRTADSYLVSEPLDRRA